MKAPFFTKTKTTIASAAVGLFGLAAPALAWDTGNNWSGGGSDQPNFGQEWTLSPDTNGGIMGVTMGGFEAAAASGADGYGDTVESQAFTLTEGSVSGGFEAGVLFDPNCPAGCGDQTWKLGLDGNGLVAAGAQNLSQSGGNGPAFSESAAAGHFKLKGITAIKADVD